MALVGGAFFSPALAGTCPWLRDVPGFTLPSRAFWRESVLSGHLPAWNPLVGLGLSTAAPVNGTFYPGHLLLLLGESVHTLPVLLALHAILAGLGAYALARALGCGAVAAGVAAVAWMLGGYAVSMWGNGEKVLSGAWLPFVVVALVQAARAPGLRSVWTALAGAALALMALAGDPFVWLDALGLGVPLAFVAAEQAGQAEQAGLAGLAGQARQAGQTREARQGEGGTATRAAARALARVGVAVGLGLLLASPALVPAWWMRDDTRRAAELTLATSEQWSLTPVRLLELVAPGALGDPLHLAAYPGAAFADAPTIQAFPWALSLYAGAACVVLPFFAGRSRTTWALASGAGLGLLAALGRHTPAGALLRAVIVPLRWMRYPEKHALLLVAALALLSGLGCERLLAERSSAGRGAVVVGALALVVFLVAPGELRATVSPGLAHFVVASLALLGALTWARRDHRAAPLVLLVVALDVAIASRPLIPWSDASLEHTPSAVPRILATAGAAPSRLLRPRRGAQTLDSLPGNLASVWGIAALPGHDPARSVRLDQLASRLGGPQTRKLAHLLRLDWGLFPEHETPDGQASWHLVESEHLPRAWIASQLVVADDEPALDTITQPGFDVDRKATVAPSPTAVALATAAVGACETPVYSADRVELACTSSAEAMVILADAHAPGWTATLDGAPAPIERANVVMRGVRIGAGSHRIAFAFAVPGLGWGLLLGVAGVLVAAWLASPGRRVRGTPPSKG